jgi:hypothetical protein
MRHATRHANVGLREGGDWVQRAGLNSAPRRLPGMAWWIAGGALLLALAIVGGLLVRAGVQVDQEDAREQLRSWDRRPPHEDD